MKPGRVITLGTALFAAIAASTLSGCAGSGSAVPRRQTGPDIGNQGEAWEVVVVGGATAPEEAAGFEHDRRDELLITHAGEGSDPPDAWPDDGRDRLDDLRRTFLPRNARSVVFFSGTPVGRSGRIWHAW